MDEKLITGSGFFFGKQGDNYLEYLINGEKAVIDLINQVGHLEVFWFSHRKRGELQEGLEMKIDGGKEAEIGKPPSNTNMDWAILLRKKIKVDDAFVNMRSCLV